MAFLKTLTFNIHGGEEQSEGRSNSFLQVLLKVLI